MNKGSEMRAETQRAGACSSEELTVAHRRLTAVVQSGSKRSTGAECVVGRHLQKSHAMPKKSWTTLGKM